jgi:hypothetical protein
MWITGTRRSRATASTRGIGSITARIVAERDPEPAGF